MIREPSAALSVEVIVSDAVAARRRMNKAVIPRIDGNVADSPALFE
jgi:hypothetical protein